MAAPLPALTLYRIDGACSLAAHITLRELEIPFTAARMIINQTTQKAEAADGTLTYEEYVREIHPNGQVPALEVHFPDLSPPSPSSPGSPTPRTNYPPNKIVAITENPAILLYIADLAASLPATEDSAPKPSLAGSNPLNRALVTSWLSFLSGSVHGQAFSALYRPRRFIDTTLYPGGEKAVREAGRRGIDLFYGQVEERLVEAKGKGEGEGEYAVGGELSVVDFNLYVFYRWGRDLGLDMEGRYPKWSRLVRRLEGRASVKTACWVEGMSGMF